MWLITVILLAWPCDASENDVLDTFMAGSGFGPFFEFSGDRKLRTASSDGTVFGMCVSILVARKVVKNHFRNIFNNLIYFCPKTVVKMKFRATLVFTICARHVVQIRIFIISKTKLNNFIRKNQYFFLTGQANCEICYGKQTYKG